MKQTAVEWLYVKMFVEKGRITKEDYDHAKEMEKEQIKNAYWLGTINYNSENDAEQYYNETYNTSQP